MLHQKSWKLDEIKLSKLSGINVKLSEAKRHVNNVVDYVLSGGRYPNVVVNRGDRA